MVQVAFYESGDKRADEAARNALQRAGFRLNASACPRAFQNQVPTPVAHFLGKGVVFGEQGIVFFANRVQRQKAPER